MTGQLSPQVTYPILLGRTVVTDVPSSAVSLLGTREMSMGEFLVPLTSEQMTIELVQEFSAAEAATHYLHTYNKIRESLDFWVPGQSIYPSDHGLTHIACSLQWTLHNKLLWIFDILQILLYSNYIMKIRISQRTEPTLELNTMLSSLCSQVHTGIKGMNRVEVSINEAFDEMVINGLRKTKDTVISKDYSAFFIKEQLAEHEAWRTLVWQRLNG
jgi:hypothetical protein